MGIIRDGEVKTRKEHKCHGCGEIIPTGSQVTYQTNTYDGNIYTLYMCNDCNGYCHAMGCRECFDMDEAYKGYIRECKQQKL